MTKKNKSNKTVVELINEAFDSKKSFTLKKMAYLWEKMHRDKNWLSK